MRMEKYALLDTDFISKTYSVNGVAGESLSDLVVRIPGYSFFCHSHIISELSCNNQPAIDWLQCSIKEQKIKCYTDEEILDELVKIRGDFACITYTQMLKDACDAFAKSYFEEHYHTLGDFNVISSEKQNYLEELQKADHTIGKQSSLGEIKSYVLLQLLSMMKGEQIYVFCSDDKAARNGVIGFDNVRCISVLSVFLRLKKEISWVLAEADPFINSYVEFCEEHNQYTFKVMEASAAAGMKRVPCRQVLLEIFDDRFVELQNGILRYKQK